VTGMYASLFFSRYLASYQYLLFRWPSAHVYSHDWFSMLTREWGGCVMVSQAAFSDNKGVIVGSRTGAVLCGHKQMALVCCPQQGGEMLFAF